MWVTFNNSIAVDLDKVVKFEKGGFNSRIVFHSVSGGYSFKFDNNYIRDKVFKMILDTITTQKNIQILNINENIVEE